MSDIVVGENQALIEAFDIYKKITSKLSNNNLLEKVRTQNSENNERFKQAIPQFRNEVTLDNNNTEPLLIPSYYHHILSVYASARCFSQDERHYQATTLMNEFEVKLEELKSKIESGEIVIKDPETGEDITTTNTTDYVYDNYFMKKNYDSDDELLLESDV